MRAIAVLLAGVLAVGAVLGATPTVVFVLDDLALRGTITNCLVTATPAAARNASSRIITKDRYRGYTDSSGTLTITNMVPGNYTVTVQGPDTLTTFALGVPDTNVTVYAHEHTTALTNSPTAGVAWSAAAADARYQLKNEHGLLLEGDAVEELVTE